MKLEKVTKRWYDDACGTALAMELVGERWSLLIVRELMFGPRRFGEIKGGLGGISANVLTQRLDGMEAAGILTRRKLPPPASVQVYELTEWGYQSETAIQELGRWAVRSPAHDPTLPLSPASLMMSFRTMLAREAVGDLDAVIGFRLGADVFRTRLDATGLAVARAEPDDAAVIFDATPPAIAAIVYGGLPLADAEAADMLRLTGDRALAERFATLFRSQL